MELNFEGGKWEPCVVIDPVPEYTVTHRGKKYTVFMPDLEPARSGSVPTKPKEAFFCSNSNPYRIKVPSENQKPAFFDEILKEAALQHFKVELRLQANAKAADDVELELVGLTVPAPPDPDTASHR